MPGTLYDHIAAIVVVGAVFIFGVVVLPSTSYVNMLYVDQQQLRNKALDVLKVMLLDAGRPEDWGAMASFNQNHVERFGLALSKSPSFYVLDPDKVQRLVEDNPLGYVEYERLRDLLGLQGYGLSIMVKPVFNVSVQDLTPGQLNNVTYEVSVAYRDMKPVPNALVKALVLYSVKVGEEDGDAVYATYCAEEELATNSLGRCTLQKTLTGEVSYVLVVWSVKVAEVTVSTATSKGGAPEDVARVNMIGDYVVLTKPKTIPNGAVIIQDITAVTSEGELVLLYNGTGEDVLNWGSLDEWSKEFPGLKDMNPVLIILDATAPEEGSGRRGKLVAGPPPTDLGSRVLSYGGAPLGATVALERAVEISGLNYVFRLVLWAES